MDVMKSAYAAYASIDPRDMRDTEFFCSTETRNELCRAAMYPDAVAPSGNQLFGRLLRIDESIPYGEVRAVCETEYDRMIRRAARDGLRVNVMKPIAMAPPVFLPSPDPTLKALVRHWWKKLKRS